MGNIVFKSKHLVYEITEDGRNVGFYSKASGKNRALEGPCAVIVCDDHTEIPVTKATRKENMLLLIFEDGTEAAVQVDEKEEYITFTLCSVTRKDFLAIAYVNILLDDQPEDFYGTLMGMTLSTRMEEHPGDNRILRAEAFPKIGLFSTRRSNYPSKAAVIGCSGEQLRRIQREVLDEIPDSELPKSSKGGPYANEARNDAMGSYTIFFETVTMDNIQPIIAQMKRFGINQINLHHFGHYVQGDFRCREQIPGGIAEFKKVIEHFHQEGILVGLHTYAFFVSPESCYVTPVPHHDLDTLREFTLAESMDEWQGYLKVCEDTEGMTPLESFVYVNSPFLWIDDELVRFSEVRPGKFEITERGVYHTIPASHKKGARVRQLKQYFNLPLAKAGSGLFYEIARNTAKFYNECGADMFYLDALDGSAVLEGEDYVWYHAVDFIREMFQHLEHEIIFDCCFNPQYTGSWFVRSRYGAIDYSRISHRICYDSHVKYNEETAERMGVTPELGWVNIYTKEAENPKNWQSELMLEEDIEYLCAKAVATNASVAILENFYQYRNLPCSEMYAQIMKKYADYRKEHVLSTKAREYMREQENAVYLKDNIFYRTRHIKNFVEGAGEVFAVYNPFEAQTPAFKLEALCAATEYDNPAAITLCRLDENIPIHNTSYRYEKAVSSHGNHGLGVWCKGDGSGAIVCICLRNLAANKKISGEHFIRVNFKGWKYFAFYENQNGSLPLEDWPRTDVQYRTYNELQNFYGHYRAAVDYEAIDGVDIKVRGEGEIYLKDLRLVPHWSPVWHNPIVRVGNSFMKILTDLHPETVLSFDGTECVIRDYNGNILEKPKFEGAIVCDTGNNEVCLYHEGEEACVRAKITLSFQGEEL